MSSIPAVALFLDLPWFDLRFPWYWRYCVAIFIGSSLIWAALSHVPISGRDGVPFPNQRFYRTCFLILGPAMVVLSLWGLWLGNQATIPLTTNIPSPAIQSVPPAPAPRFRSQIPPTLPLAWDGWSAGGFASNQGRKVSELRCRFRAGSAFRFPTRWAACAHGGSSAQCAPLRARWRSLLRFAGGRSARRGPPGQSVARRLEEWRDTRIPSIRRHRPSGNGRACGPRPARRCCRGFPAPGPHGTRRHRLRFHRQSGGIRQSAYPPTPRPRDGRTVRAPCGSE